MRPILSAMRRNKMGVILIAAQIAMTLAILCNALFIIEQRVASSYRPTGADENNVFVITNQWIGNPPDLAARLRGDLAALRALPGVIDASASNSYVLSENGLTESIKLKVDQKTSSTKTAVYYGDEHAVRSLGLNLIAGRNFNSDEVAEVDGNSDPAHPAGVIITRALAQALFPGDSALGKRIFVGTAGVPVIGIIERLQGPWVDAWWTKFSDNSVILPFRFVAPRVHYVVHAQAGQFVAVLKAAEKKLFEVSRGRVLVKSKSLLEARAQAYRDDRGLAVILVVVCAALVAVTAFGIVGLTSYWVAQRRRQIGIRRALGATRRAIVEYFQTENLLIATAGAAVGIALALSANLWMVNAFAMERLQVGYAFLGAIIVLVLGQAAVLWPALKAASIPPWLAIRGA
jgi:putative ABC transport system permease protein